MWAEISTDLTWQRNCQNWLVSSRGWVQRYYFDISYLHIISASSGKRCLVASLSAAVSHAQSLGGERQAFIVLEFCQPSDAVREAPL